MAEVCVEKLPHYCGTSDALQVWYSEEEEKYSGYCFKCNTYVDNPYNEDRPKPDVKELSKSIEEDLNEIKQYPLINNTYRDIPQQFWERFRVRQWFNEATGQVEGTAFPYSVDNGTKLTAFKSKLIEKRDGKKVMWCKGAMKPAEPFGWSQAIKTSGPTLYITEGEEDAVALTYALFEFSTSPRIKGNYQPVISLKAGASSARKQLEPFLREINKRWKSVILVFDMDDAGEKAVMDVRKVLPGAKTATLPLKDANECVSKGLGKELVEALLFKSDAPSLSRAVNLEETIKEAMEPVKLGKSSPWEELDFLTLGQRKGELWSIGGGTGIGKTLLGYSLAAHNALHHDWNTLAAFMEATSKEVVQNLAGQVSGTTYHIPETKFTKEQFTKDAEIITPHLILWDNNQSTYPEENWEGLKLMIKESSSHLDMVLLDNLTTLSEGMGLSEANEFIAKVAKEAADIAMKFDILFIIFSHLNSPPKGQRSHENGGKVLESQFTGSRGLQRYSHMMVGFERNKMAIDPSVSKIRLLKNRKFGKTGYVKTRYDGDTGKLFCDEWDESLFKDKQ